MVQLRILSGKMAGASWAARRFPVRVGRSSNSDLRLEEDGIWEHHLLLELDREGFAIKVQPNALVRINGQPSAGARLRNGDTIELGIVRLQFWLGDVRQNRLQLREIVSWGAIAAVTLGQLAIMYWLLR